LRSNRYENTNLKAMTKEHMERNEKML